MANWNWFGKVHSQLIRITGGRIGARMVGIDMALIEAIGRKSGVVRAVPIACYPYQDSVVVVASNNGQDKHPLWWLNLEAHPNVFVRVGTERYEVIAELLTGEEREIFLPQIYKINPRQKTYVAMTKRVLPVVYLKRKNTTDRD